MSKMGQVTTISPKICAATDRALMLARPWLFVMLAVVVTTLPSESNVAYSRGKHRFNTVVSHTHQSLR